MHCYACPHKDNFAENQARVIETNIMTIQFACHKQKYLVVFQNLRIFIYGNLKTGMFENYVGFEIVNALQIF